MTRKEFEKIRIAVKNGAKIRGIALMRDDMSFNISKTEFGEDGIRVYWERRDYLNRIVPAGQCWYDRKYIQRIILE